MSTQMVDTSSVAKCSDEAELTEDNIPCSALADYVESHSSGSSNLRRRVFQALEKMTMTSSSLPNHAQTAEPMSTMYCK